MKRLLAACAVAALSLAPASAAPIQSPSDFLGFPVGADRKVADYRQIVSYFRMLETTSPRVEALKTLVGA